MASPEVICYKGDMAASTSKPSRGQVPVFLWLGVILMLCLGLCPRTTLLGDVISGLGQIGMAVCWALIVPFTAPTAIGFRVFLWLLVVAMIGFQGSAVYFHWQADQLQLPTS